MELVTLRLVESQKMKLRTSMCRSLDVDAEAYPTPVILQKEAASC